MYADRQNRVRVLRALEERSSSSGRGRRSAPASPSRACRRRCSHRPHHRRAVFAPLSLRSRTRLWLEWPDGATWELGDRPPVRLKLYCDYGGCVRRVCWNGRRDSEIETDRLLLGFSPSRPGTLRHRDGRTGRRPASARILTIQRSWWRSS